MRRIAATLFSLPLLLFLIPVSVSATDCSSLPNTHPATAGEVPGVAAGTCVPNGQNNLLNGGCDFNPYPIVESFKTGSSVHITPSNSGGTLTDGINPALACRVAQFLKYAQTQGCTFKITSGYRSAQEQQNLCGSGGDGCAAAGRSCHQYGLAVDVTSSPQCMNWAHNTLGVTNTAAVGAQQFKIFFPIRVAVDPVHIQCVEDTVGACNQNTKPCDGSVNITPNLSVIPGPSSNLPFDNSIRQALGVPPPPPPPAPMQQALPTTPITTVTTPITTVQATSTATPPPVGTLNSTPYPAGTCNPQTYCSQSDGNIYYRTTMCVDQVYQTCANGCTGFICNASSTSATNSQLSGLSMPTVTNDNSNSNSNSNGTSSFDLISYFANNPITATDIGTATPIDISQLVQDTGNASVLQPPPATGQPIQTPPQGSATGYGPVPQQTFASPDLSNTSGVYGTQSSTFQSAIAGMKATLIGILNYLQPFGGLAAPTQAPLVE